MVKTLVWAWKDDAELLSVRQLLYPDPQLDSKSHRENQQLGVNIVREAICVIIFTITVTYI